jgi:nitroreductase
MIFNDISTPATLLATRRSGKPRDLVAPGPDPAQLREICLLALRTPDHGKIAPWRFVIVPDERRAALAERMVAALRAERPDAPAHEAEALQQFAHQAPALVVVLSSPQPDHKVPMWEQELSAGAATMNLCLAVHAHGYVAGWLTGWPAFSDRVRDAFGQAPERIAGFVFIGTPGRPLDERPRPDADRAVSVWQG